VRLPDNLKENTTLDAVTQFSFRCPFLAVSHGRNVNTERFLKSSLFIFSFMQIVSHGRPVNIESPVEVLFVYFLFQANRFSRKTGKHREPLLKFSLFTFSFKRK
jgi:hypothetical protein